MDVYETVEAILDSNNGEIVGRTAIHKLVYLSEKTIDGLTLPLYKPHYYGPYSPDLSLALEKMVTYSFIDEIKIPGRMHEGYKYRLTSDGQDMADHVKTTYPNEYQKINSLVSTCKQSCGLKTAPLSYAAKVYFMLENNSDKEKQMDYDVAIKTAEKLGWELTPDDIDQGVELLEQLKLVNIVRN